MKTDFKNRKGFSLIEVILSSALISIFVVMFIGAIIDVQDNVTLVEKRKDAVRVAEAGLEIIRNIRDSGFANLIDGNQSELINNIYTRTITISSVNTKTKKIESNVVWSQNERRNGEVNLVTYLTNQTLP